MVRRCCVEKAFTAFICSWFLRLLDQSTDDDIKERKREITFQFLFTIDEASFHLDFYGDFLTFSFFFSSHYMSFVLHILLKSANEIPSQNKNFVFYEFLLHSFLSALCVDVHIHDSGSIMKIGINCLASDGAFSAFSISHLTVIAKRTNKDALYF